MQAYRLILQALLVGLVVADFNDPLSRAKRFSTQSCTISPDSTEDKIIDRNQAVKLSCSLDGTVQSCIWTHYKPSNAKTNYNEPDILCTSGSTDSGRPCETDTRITFQPTPTSCGITVSNTNAEDTGKWRLIAVGLTTSLQPQTTQKDFELFTYNQTYTRLVDKQDVEIRNTIETSYNWNTKTEEWESGKSDYETLEIRCQAYGGRPVPNFIWFVDNNNNDNLYGQEGFQVSDGQLPSGDPNNYIKNLESRITFKVDDRLLRRLEKYSINTNPSNGIISFELRCDAQQNGISSMERTSARINIKKAYDDGNLTAGTIGIIVGVVVAVILAVIAIALLVFAKSSGRWCFAEDEEAYRKPQEAKPRSAGGPPSHTQSAQVHRGSNADLKTEAKPRGQPLGPSPIRRSSSTASSNDNSQNTKSSKEIKGEWIPDHKQPTSIIKKSSMGGDSGRSSNSPAPSSDSSHSHVGVGMPPPPRPYKPPELQYANLDHGRSFMIDPRNRVLPSTQHPQHQPPATAYATIVSNSKIV